MSYTLLLLRVPPGTSEDDIEGIARATTEAEDRRAPGPVDPEVERRRRTLVEVLLAECPELAGGEPDYVALARVDDISDQQARDHVHWWTVVSPEEGAHIEITLYDDYVSVELPSKAGTDQDWKDVWRYLEILVREGEFVVWDPQGPGLVDLAAGPFGDGRRRNRPDAPKSRRKRKQDVEDEEDDPTVEREDIRRGGEISKLINRIVDEAIAEPLAAVGFRRSGRTWRRALDNGLFHVVDVQWSPRERGVEGAFWLGAGVYSRALAESLALFQPTNSPKEHDCHVRLRPGPQGRNSWQVRVPGIATPDPDVTGLLARVFGWFDRRADSKASDQHARATRELREAFERHALPAFERLSTLRGLRDELARSTDLYWAAHASFLLGEREEAKQLLARALNKARDNPDFSETIREWARRQGLS